MKWFRFFHDTLLDPKIQSLSGDLYKAWGNLLCMASRNPVRGTLPDLTHIAFFLHMTPQATQSILDELTERKLLDKSKTGYRLHDWDEWQTDRSPNAERQKRFRDRHRDASKHADNGEPNVTRSVTRNAKGNASGNGSVTTKVTGDQDLELENTKTPLPPAGGSVCVSSPTPIPDADAEDEPFNAPGKPAPAPVPPRVKNDPAEVKRVAAKAERLFPVCDFGMRVERAADDVPMVDMDQALDIAFDKGKREWPYIRGILKRFAVETPDQQARRRSPKPVKAETASEWDAYYVPTEADIERVRFVNEKLMQKAEARRREEEAARQAGQPTGPKLFSPRPMERRA